MSYIKTSGNYRNGIILSFRNKLDNSHFESLNDKRYDEIYEFYYCKKHCIIFTELITSQQFEIYSVEGDTVYKIGDNYDNGIITGFFVYDDEIFIRVTHIIEELGCDIELKTSCTLLN